MKPIVKSGRGTPRLQQAALQPPQTPQVATAAWSRFRRRKGNQALLQKHLLPEQWGLCGYSELDADRLGLGFHIEHVENKSQNPLRTFDYGNLIACTFTSRDLQQAKVQGLQVFGGHTAGKQGKPLPVDMVKFVSPLQADSARFFAYLSDGRVEPRLNLNQIDTDRAQYTIDLLNLNSPYLVGLRRAWWDELDRLFEEHQNAGWSVVHLAAIDLLPRGDRLSRFFSLTRQFFGPVAEQVLRDQAPALL